MHLPSTSWIPVFLIAFICWRGWEIFFPSKMSSKKKYLYQSFTMVRRAEDALFKNICWPLFSPPLQIWSWLSGLQPPALRPTFHFTWCAWTSPWGSPGECPILWLGEVTEQRCAGELQTPPLWSLWILCFWEPPAAQIGRVSPTLLCFHNFWLFHTLFGIFPYP